MELEKTGFHIRFEIKDREKLTGLFNNTRAKNIRFLGANTANFDLTTALQFHELHQKGFTPQIGRIGIITG